MCFLGSFFFGFLLRLLCKTKAKGAETVQAHVFDALDLIFVISSSQLEIEPSNVSGVATHQVGESSFLGS